MTMAKLIYTTISSLDGYVADDEGNFEWSAPDEECIGSSMTWSGRSEFISTGVGCMR